MRISVNDGDVVRIYACTKHSYIQNNKITLMYYLCIKRHKSIENTTTLWYNIRVVKRWQNGGERQLKSNYK